LQNLTVATIVFHVHLIAAIVGWMMYLLLALKRVSYNSKDIKKTARGRSKTRNNFLIFERRAK